MYGKMPYNTVMYTYQTDKNERLEARISPQLKQLLTEAAAIRGSTLTEFIISAVEKEAKKVVHDHEIMKLSVEDSADFVYAIANPPKPNKKLREALKDYKKHVRSK